ncbi:unnamed protein product [Leptosia nina]|uniref:Ionotropic glutamate receptor C-terminal domain-containing protein n=1 Tax=Leptosia nina TaxID=320188 RepID=A0AAV1J356_9NEOP
MTYVRRDSSFNEDYEVPHGNTSVDFYARPMTLKEEYLTDAYPLHSIFQWRFGFLLRYKQNKSLQTFYSLPFTIPVWVSIIWTLLLSTVVFYILSYWERRLIGGETCLHHEFLLAFSAFCQHILPLQANLCSRRIAYFIFIFSAYIIHCFYTSNLLSHLVNDKDRIMDLKDLSNSDYEFVIIKDMNLITDRRIHQLTTDKHLKTVEKKFQNTKVMTVSSALTAVRDSKTAVLTDYKTLYPLIKRMFENHAICELMEVDLYPNRKGNTSSPPKILNIKKNSKLGE